MLNVIDFNSTDGNYKQILKSSKLKFKYYNPLKDSDKLTGNSTKFNKVKMLNYGIKKVKNENSIIFILDLHLQLPLNIFDRIRKVKYFSFHSFISTVDFDALLRGSLFNDVSVT